MELSSINNAENYEENVETLSFLNGNRPHLCCSSMRANESAVGGT